MSETKLIKVAAVQAAPVYFDLPGCIKKAKTIIAQASQQACDLVVFGEAWFPGYPFHIWLGPPAWSMQYTNIYFDNSMEVGSAPFLSLCHLAKQHNIMLSFGFSERQGASLYLSQCLIDQQGEVVSVRRKLKPTHVERCIYGEGYGGDLVVSETALGNIGQLCCWEHLQPLSKYAMYSQNEQIHLAAWPAFSVYKEKAHALGIEVNMAASQVYAVEGSCYVVAATSIVDNEALAYFKIGEDVPPLLSLGGGAAMIFAPDGRRLGDAIPEDQEGLVIADIDLNAIKLAKAVADPAGHYSKPEATQLIHHKTARQPVITVDSSSETGLDDNLDNEREE